MESHRRMGVAEVAVLLVAGADLPCTCSSLLQPQSKLS